MISERASFTAFGEPGRQNTAFPLITPAIALVRITDVPISSRLLYLKSSPKPGISFSKRGIMDSIVRSFGESPVPPLVIIISAELSRAAKRPL